jgi:hypothetical protein
VPHENFLASFNVQGEREDVLKPRNENKVLQKTYNGKNCNGNFPPSKYVVVKRAIFHVE